MQQLRTRLAVTTLALIISAALHCNPASAIPTLCEDQCFSRQDNGLFSCQHNCGANTDRQKIPAGLEFLASRVQSELRAPVVKSATATPELAAPGDAIHIKITMEKNAAPESLPTVTAYYSYDDMKSWRAARADFNQDDNTFDSSFIAPLDAATITWFIRAISPDENSYIELPCDVKNFPFTQDECLVPLVTDSSYKTYDEFTVDPALDIIQGKFGEDSEYYYILYVTEGDISPGEKLDSLKFMYIAAFADPAGYSRIEPLDNVMFLTHAPQFYQPQLCAIIARRGRDWTTETSSVECIVDKNMIMFKVKKKLLMPFKSGLTNIFLGANALTDFDWGVIKDYTGVTSIRKIHREIVLAKPTAGDGGMDEK